MVRAGDRPVARRAGFAAASPHPTLIAMSITVTVVIPTYNRPQATGRAVRSVLAQTYAIHEIIVVDDASVPAFAPVANGCTDARISVMRLDRNVGASAARQAGVDAATGDVVAFLDSDDVWLPEKLATQILVLEKVRDEMVAVACGWETVPEHGQRPTTRIPIASADVTDFASGCWYCPGTTVIVPRHVFDTVGPFDPNLRRLEDFDWFLRFALAGGRIAVAPIIGAIVSTGRRSLVRPVSDACEKILGRFGEHEMPLRNAVMTRRLRAYLALERAAAARNERRPFAMAWYLARSFALVPRISVPLKNWWKA